MTLVRAITRVIKVFLWAETELFNIQIPATKVATTTTTKAATTTTAATHLNTATHGNTTPH